MSISTKKPQTVQTTVTTPDIFIPQADQWVHLRDALSDYSADTALLLCEGEKDHWIAWVPGFGQAILERSQLLQAKG